jgi:phage shock protein A
MREFGTELLRSAGALAFPVDASITSTTSLAEQPKKLKELQYSYDKGLKKAEHGAEKGIKGAEHAVGKGIKKGEHEIKKGEHRAEKAFHPRSELASIPLKIEQSTEKGIKKGEHAIKKGEHKAEKAFKHATKPLHTRNEDVGVNDFAKIPKIELPHVPSE